MSRRITNDTGFDLYRYTSADASSTPSGNGYLFANNTSININVETMICVPVNSDLLSVQLTNGTILTVNKKITGSLSVYNNDTGDYDDISVHPLSNYMGYTSSDTTLTAHETAQTKKQWTVTANLTNCTLTPTDTKIDNNTQVTFTVTANTGYYITTVPTVNGVNMSKVSGTVYTYTVNVTSDVTIIATASKTGASNTITYKLQNATGTPTTANEGEPTTVTITADDGYTLVTVTGTYLVESGDTESINFTISSDKKTATATFTIPADYLTGQHSIEISCTSTQAPVTKVLNDLIAIYNPTDEELGEISTKQFITAEGDVYKLSEFITSYKKFAISPNILSDYIVGKNYAVLGYYDTGVEVNVLNNFLISLPSISFDIPRIHNNSLDYTDNEYSAYLPFVGIVDLPTKIAGYTLTFSITINLFTGNINYIVSFFDKKSLKGEVINSWNGKCAFDVPYKTSDILWDLYNKDSQIEINLTVTNIVISILYHNELSNNNLYSTSQWVTLADITGYVQFSDVDLTSLTDANYTEKDELETILEKGVFL